MSIIDGRSLPWRAFDRVIRPFSLAVSLATFVLTMGIVTREPTLSVALTGVAALGVAAAGASSTALLWWGWWRRSVDAMTQGLLVSVGVWSAAGASILLGGTSWVWGGISLCISIGSAGAWLLEVNDPNTKGG